MCVKRVNIFKDIELENFNSIETIFFDLQKFNIYDVTQFLKNSFFLED